MQTSCCTGWQHRWNGRDADLADPQWLDAVLDCDALGGLEDDDLPNRLASVLGFDSRWIVERDSA